MNWCKNSQNDNLQVFITQKLLNFVIIQHHFLKFIERPKKSAKVYRMFIKKINYEVAALSWDTRFKYNVSQ